MLERLQSALKTVKDSKPSSMMSHGFVTVRRGSPAARSGQIQPGDQLEAVEGRSVLSLPHRDLAQLLRRAGNTLRLTLIPRSTTNNPSQSEGPEMDADSRASKACRGRLKVQIQQEQRYYSVDLERGPTGFGFSLRGGSEYNMGLYVLGLMEGGPASRSHKIQVSDQLVEINGDSTTGMTHSQAVEQIRRGGHRIHLVLKTGNGYVPDYDHDPRTASLAPVESSVAALENTPSLQTKNRKGERGRGGGRREMGDGRRNWGDLEEGRSRGRGQSPGRQREGGGLGGVRSSGGGGNPDTDLDWPDEEERQPGSHIGQSSLDVADRPKMGHGRVVQRSKQSRRRDRREHLSGVQVMEEMEVQASLLSVRGKRRGGVREPEAAGPAVEDSGPSERDSEVPSFSFLKPLPDGEAGLSDAESSEASRSSWACLSASSVCASTAGAPPPWRGQREETWCPPVCHQADHASYTAGSSTQARRTANAPGAPGPWIKPSQQKLSQVLRAPRIRAGLDL